MSYKKLCGEIINSYRYPIESTVFIQEREFIDSLPLMLAHKASKEWPIEKIIESMIFRYGLNGNDDKTINDVAEQFGATYGSVHRIHLKVKRLLRKTSNLEIMIPGLSFELDQINAKK